MPAVIALQNAGSLTVDPGQSTTCELSIANTGTIVEQFNILFLGDVEPWTTADPPVVSLFPGAQQNVTLIFAPPRDHTVVSGLVHFAVKVVPSNEPDESVTEEGTIMVGSFNDLGAELVPRVVNGRTSGRQRLAIDSRGNTPIPVDITAIDPSDSLRFQIRPDRLTAAPGQAHFVRIRIRPRQRKWRGHADQKPYQVQVAAEGETPIVLGGALNHKVIIPKWVFAAVALIAAALLLWFFLIKPAVHSTAVNANRAALAAQQKKIAEAQNSAAAAQNSASAAQNAVSKLTGKPTTTTTTVKKPASTTTTTKPATSTTGPPVTSPTDGSISVVAPPGGSQAKATPTGGVPSGTTMQVADLVLENVSGSSGIARVERVLGNGQVQVLLVENLANLNGQQYHFDPTIYFTHTQALQLEVDCQPNQTACSVNMFYTGPITQPQSATTTTVP